MTSWRIIHYTLLSATACSLVVATSLPAAAVNFTLPASDRDQGKFGDTLVDAADAGNLPAVKSLIKSGKYVDTRGQFETTALARASFRGHTEIADYLLSVGANPNVEDMGGATPLHLAAREGHKEIVALLVAKGAEMNAADKEGWTPLMRASINQKLPAVQALLDAGASVDATNKRGETALMQAVKKDDVATAQLLLQYGADRGVRGQDGKTAADIAFDKDHADMHDVLANTEQSLSPQAPEATAMVTDGQSELAQLPVASSPAAPVLHEEVAYLLQLGTFDNRASAERAMKRFEHEYSDLFDGLTPIVAEVTLNGGQTVLYRAQLGYITDKDAARKHCDAFLDKRVDCYVVESAVASVPPVPGETTTVQEQRDVPWEVTSTTTAPVPVADNADTKPPVKNKKRSILSLLPWADDEEESATEASAVEVKAPTPAMPVVSYGDEGADQVKPLKVVTSSADIEQPVAEAPTPLIEQAAAQEVSVEPEDTMSMAAPVERVSEPRVVNIKEQAASSALPPLQSSEQTDAMFEGSGAPQPLVVHMPEAASHAVHSRPVSGSEVADLRAQVPAATPTVSNAHQLVPLQQTEAEMMAGSIDNATDVAVAEAIRVPLSSPQSPARAPIAERITTPSRTTNLKTQWAEIDSFTSEAEAKAFWNDLSREQPEVTSGLRMRMAKPLKSRGPVAVKMRVGPVRTQEHFDELCDAAHDAHKLCHVIEDMGASIAARAPRQRLSEHERQEERPVNRKYPHVQDGYGSKAYWAHLGSFPKKEEAQEIWDMLVDLYPSVLNEDQYAIVRPPVSSAAQANYRLRIGPFETPYITAAICETLKQRNPKLPCLPVHSE